MCLLCSLIRVTVLYAGYQSNSAHTAAAARHRVQRQQQISECSSSWSLSPSSSPVILQSSNMTDPPALIHINLTRAGLNTERFCVKVSLSYRSYQVICRLNTL